MWLEDECEKLEVFGGDFSFFGTKGLLSEAAAGVSFVFFV